MAEIIDNKPLNDYVGSPIFMAPELISKFSYNQKVDIWAFGCIIFELICGKAPFIATNPWD